jgi:hypothetical protein
VFLVVGGNRTAVMSKRLTPYRKLVNCRICIAVLQTALAARERKEN